MAYRLGTSLDAMYTLSEIGVIDPASMPINRTRRFYNASGGYVDTGWITQEWWWGYLTEEEADILREYVGQVYMCTRDNSGAWGVYSAYMTWPESEPEHYAGHVIDLTITFRNMNYICKEDEL